MVEPAMSEKIILGVVNVISSCDSSYASIAPLDASSLAAVRLMPQLQEMTDTSGSTRSKQQFISPLTTKVSDKLIEDIIYPFPADPPGSEEFDPKLISDMPHNSRCVESGCIAGMFVPHFVKALMVTATHNAGPAMQMNNQILREPTMAVAYFFLDLSETPPPDFCLDSRAVIFIDIGGILIQSVYESNGNYTVIVAAAVAQSLSITMLICAYGAMMWPMGRIAGASFSSILFRYDHVPCFEISAMLILVSISTAILLIWLSNILFCPGYLFHQIWHIAWLSLLGIDHTSSSYCDSKQACRFSQVRKHIVLLPKDLSLLYWEYCANSSGIVVPQCNLEGHYSSSYIFYKDYTPY